MRNTTFISSLALLLIAATSVVGEDVHYAGEIKLPAIARHRLLLNRMVEELTIVQPKLREELPEGSIAFFQNLLTNADADLQLDAVRALGEIARGKHGDISSTIPAITKLLSHPNKELRRAAALALLAADAKQCSAELLKLSQSSNDRLRMIVEPALARWNFEPAAAMWIARVQDESASTSSLTLAASGLAALEKTEASAAIRGLSENQNISYQSRHAAGVALSSLDPDSAQQVATKLVGGSLRDRLLAVVLLNNADQKSLDLLTQLSTDKTNAVAAKAWTQLAQLDSTRLQNSVSDGSIHPDSGVRLAAIRVMNDFPNEPHTKLLATLMGDPHIQVRNDARSVLLKYAATNPKLKKQVVENAAAAVVANDSWERTEQSLLIAASLGQTQFTAKSVPLLEHKRPEVFVTAAWFMHLYPDALVMDTATPIISQRYEMRTEPGLGEDIDLQMSFLFQAAGSTEHKPVQPLCEAQFSKGSGLSWAGRSGGIYAIGMMNRDNPDPGLVGKLLGRLNDRESQMPELDQVRRMAVMSIGRMGAKDQIDELMKAHAMDPPLSVIPEAARWALTRLGVTDLPAKRIPADLVRSVGGWNVYPVSKRK